MAAVTPVLGNINPQQSAPKESPNAPPQDYGPNNEKLNDLKPELVEALRTITTEYRSEGIVARRHEIRRIRQARMFWQGLHYAWYDHQHEMWVVPFTIRNFDDKDLQEMPRYMYVTNIYLAYGLTFVAVLSSDVPNVRTRPAKASKVEDITAAEASTNVINLIEENNNPEELLSQTAMYLFTDGKIGGYVRYISDAQRFGERDEPDLGQAYAPMGEDMYTCPQCQAQSSEEDVAATGMLACPQCGAQLGPENLEKADRMAIPSVTGTRKVPNGQEVISIIGGLELNTPVWANFMYEYPYLQWQQEVHRAKLKASYPHIEDKIQMGGSQSADEVYARTSRLSVAQGLPAVVPGDTLYDLVTFSRTWIRPWAFYRIDEKDIRSQLLKLFPKGCYVAFAGDTYCESRNESMDDKWRVMHAYPGDGQNRPSVGDPILENNMKLNTLTNIVMETADYGVGTHFADPAVINFDALENQTAEPGAWYPANPRPGQALEASFKTEQSDDVPQFLGDYAEQLAGESSQFLTGLFPAIFGGEAKGAGGETAKGYQLSRDQAMGRIGLVYRKLKRFYADLMMLGVKCFAENRPEDVEVAVEGVDGNDEPDWIRLSDLQGNIKVIPEGDQDFPRMASQQRDTVERMLTVFAKDPAFMEMVDLPSNQEWIKGIEGLSELELPAVAARQKQMRETKELLQGQPQPGVGAMGEPVMKSSVQVHPMDNHVAEGQEMERFHSSRDGQKAKQKNPLGYANFTAHWKEHQQAQQAKMLAAMPPPAPEKQPPGEKTA